MRIEGVELDRISFYDSTLFAIRCTRRVQPLFNLNDNLRVCGKYIVLQEEALSLAEEVIQLQPDLSHYLFRGLKNYLGPLNEACALSAGSETSNATATSIVRSVQSVIDWMYDNPTNNPAYAIDASIVAGTAVDKSFFKTVQGDFFQYRTYLDEVLLPGALPKLDWASLWSDVSPFWFKMSQQLQQDVLQNETREKVNGELLSPPMIEIIWDPEIISHEEYSDIVKALGDLARSQGALGVERIRSTSCDVPTSEGALL
ncbi:hypothetical protein [Bremerella alba]|uniref:Uncharacterized protein n=1 Tax=Bremerella alba TaxID=980252 RepID=A0A7V8V4H4_9BACT|nr:hypothetical protein [Bremerella alba]MBA2114660.1 hypothetical protein [Bremerella alba]